MSKNINALEPADFNSIVCSYYLNDIMLKNNAKCYNVSSQGVFSNKIPRITFDSIFISNKEYIKPTYIYTDFIDQINNIVDFNFYYVKYISNIPIDEELKKLKVFSDIILEGIYCKKQLNPNIRHQNEIEINTFSISVFCCVCFINNYSLITEINRSQIHIFFCHFASKFCYKVVDIYNKTIFNENYFNILLKEHTEQLTNFNINSNNFINKQHMHHFSGFKYFKLLVYLMNK